MYSVVMYVACLGGYRAKVVSLISHFNNATCSINQSTLTHIVISLFYDGITKLYLICYIANLVRMVHDFHGVTLQKATESVTEYMQTIYF